MRIAINGIGIAGPTLAYWLERSGHEVLLVETWPHLRTGGYVIDFWGAGYDVADRMGLIPRICQRGYQIREVRFVDRSGRTCGGFPVDVLSRATAGRFTSLPRSALSSTLYESLTGNVQTILGDSIAAIEDRGNCVRIAFDRADDREVDLVIGADGLHSRVRQLVFGPQSQFEVPLGYTVAAFEVAGYKTRDELVSVAYAVPGRTISRLAMREDKTLFLCVFRDEYLKSLWPADSDARKAAVQRIFGHLGWECDEILSAMQGVRDVYFDRVSQIRMPRWTSGRTVLVGDAASAVSLMAGEGAGLAMAQSYVLAGELHTAHNDFAAAFARYEARMMEFVRGKQATAARFASSFAPRTQRGIRARNLVTRFLRVPLVAEFFLTRSVRDDIVLPDYGL